MSRVQVHNFSVSRRLRCPASKARPGNRRFGHAGTRLLEWACRRAPSPRWGLHGDQPGTTGVDEAFASRWNTGIGARRSWGATSSLKPDRGPTMNGPAGGVTTAAVSHAGRRTHPPPRPPLELDGGTTFHFLDATPVEALDQARELAGDLDIRIGGGTTTVRDFFGPIWSTDAHRRRAHLPRSRRTALDGLEGLEDRFDIDTVTSPSGVVHVSFSRPSVAQ